MWIQEIQFDFQKNTMQPFINSISENSFQIDSTNSCSTSKKLQFWLKIVKITLFLNNKTNKSKIGLYFANDKKITRWCFKSKITKTNVKTMISSISFQL